MLSELWRYLQTRSPTELGRDVLDVLIIYYIFYRVALVLKGTRAMQVVVGLALVFVLYGFAILLQLNTVLTLLNAVLSSAILIGVVVFQNDIRRGLMRVGARAQLGSGQTLEGKLIDDVVEAATMLARHRTGAIMTFEQEANLDEFVGSHTGHVIDAAMSPELLISLFIPEAMNKLHDGAVIIRDLRIAKAGVFFPMPEGRVADDNFGSRHRAAMGITEETDAVVVVVSEERGSISFCFNGNIIPNLDGPRLRAALEGVFATKAPTKRRPKTLWQRLVRRMARAVVRDETVVPASTRPPPPTLTVEAPITRRRKPSEAPAPLRKKKGEARDKSSSRKLVAEDHTLDGAVRPSQPPEAIPLKKADSGRLDEDGRRTLLTGEIARTPLRHMAPAQVPREALDSLEGDSQGAPKVEREAARSAFDGHTTHRSPAASSPPLGAPLGASALATPTPGEVGEVGEVGKVKPQGSGEQSP